MDVTNNQRIDNNSAPTNLALPWTIISALALLAYLHFGNIATPNIFARSLTQFEAACVAVLATGCLLVLFAQAKQPRMNRTPIIPGLVLIYGSYLASEAFTAGAHAYPATGLATAHVLYGIVCPCIGVATSAIAIGVLVMRRPINLKSYGEPQFYRADPALIAETAPASSDQGRAKPTQPAKQDQPAGQQFRFPALRPRTTFADLYGNDSLKEALGDAGRAWRETGKNGILLFGPPGTGKTAFAEALAGELGIGFEKITFGDTASQWINKSTEQLKLAFTEAKAQQPVMLFIDEADSLLKERGTSGGYEEYDRLVTTFLTEVVDVRGQQVLVVAATNYIDKLDDAAVREGRFDFKVQVPLPDAPARRKLIETAIAARHCTTDDGTLQRLTKRWGGFNVPRLIACSEGACDLARGVAGLPAKPADGEPEAPTTLCYDDFYHSLRKIQGRKAGAPEGAKALSDLFLDPEPAARLQNLATQFTDVDAVERMGGSIPKGLLFFGPPGTGKTATAKALARECGWSFIVRTGRQLLESGAVQKLGREASDLRPAIVFIDEADDILGDRQSSPYKSATNEVLTLIDGANGTLCDVVWIAATNNPDSMDAAATRGGRFGQKIGFFAPSEETAKRMIVDWVQRKSAANAVEIDSKDAESWAVAVYPHLRGFTPSDVYQALEAANNEAITASLRAHGPRIVTPAHVERAAAELRG